MAKIRPLADLPRPGDLFVGKYEIVRLIGEGGMGSVFEAVHKRLRQRVAIKLLLPHFLHVGEVVTRFEREGRTAAQLRSRHVARILDVDVTPAGLPFMVMEYLEGRDLDAEIQQRGRLPVAEAVGYVLQAADAMIEAHDAGIVHRDLKPANLFVCPERGEPVIKVLDFGISKMRGEDDARLTGTHATVGTPLYMSPEQVRSAKSVDLRTDIWSLGVILFELLVGRPPFVGSTTGAAASIVIDPVPKMRELGVEVPAELEAAIGRALEKEADRRFPDVRTFADAIAPFAPPVAAGVATARTMPLSPSGPSFEPGRVSGPPVEPAVPSGGAAANRTFASAATISSPSVPGYESPSNVAKTAPSRSAQPPPTSPGWTTRSAPGKKGPRGAAWLVLGLPVLALAAGILWWRSAGTGPSIPAAAPGSAASSAAAPPSASWTSEPAPAAASAGEPRPPTTSLPSSAPEDAPSAPRAATKTAPSSRPAPHPSAPARSAASPNPPPQPAPSAQNPIFL